MSTKTSKTKKTKATEAQAPAATETLSSDPTSFPTNLYTDDELRISAEGSAAYDQMANDRRRHPDDILKKVGPALLVARDGAMKIAGTTNVHAQAYRDAIPGALKRLKLDHIPRSERSYCLKIMDNLADIEAWLAERPNPDRLNHPKTIWKAWYDHETTKWEDDPGVDWEDDHEYWGEEPPEPPEQVDCDHCGQKTIHFVPRADGRYFCPVCHEANPEQAIAGDDEARGDDVARGDGDADGAKPKRKPKRDKDHAGADQDQRNEDKDHAGANKDSTGDEDDDDTLYWNYIPTDFDNLDWGLDSIAKDLGETTDLSTIEADDRTKAIERLERVITKARGCINALETNDKKHLDPDHAPTIAPTADNEKLRQRNADLESTLDAAEATRVSLFLDKNCLKLENDALRKQLAKDQEMVAPPTVPADDLTPKVDRKIINKELKKVGNDARKVKPSDVGL
jgi:hypothetical protein